MKRFFKCVLIFTVGALGYGAIELLWRGRTHPTMLAAGGCVFSFACFINSRFRRGALWLKSCVLCTMIWTVELFFGLIFNIILGMNVWSYSDRPFNLYGQICLLYCALWGVLSFVICALYERFTRRLLQG